MFSAVTRTVFKASARSINSNRTGALFVARNYAEAVSTNRAENKLRLTVATPSGALYTDTVVEKVKIPGASGDYTVLANHVPYISELRPGIVIIVKEDKTEERYFTSGGFAFVHRDSTCNINAVEIVPLSELDGDAAQRALGKWQEQSTRATNEKDKAIARIGLEAATAIVQALGIAAK